MKKLVSLAVIITMTLTLAPAAVTLAEDLGRDLVVITVEASDGQAKLTAAEKAIIDVDGLKFKDLNANGALDVYEDWRQDIDSRVDDLLSLMTLDEKIGLLHHNTTGGTFTSLYPITEEWMWSDEERIAIDGTEYTPMYHSIISDFVTTYLHNVNGTPKEQLDENNTIQQIGELGRLGIPIALSCDRSYNTWAGMVDMPHYAFGTAHDEQLLYDLVAQYAKEEYALGYHVPFHPYGVEIGSWYGDEVNYIARMTGIEVKAYEENGVNATTKHFIARGGRNSYSSAVSPANLTDSWMIGWKAAVDAGTSWIMTNNGTGLTPGVNVYFDTVTIGYLRDTLGYEGVIVTDWPLFMASPTGAGITAEGKDLSQMTAGELYTQILETGVDQFGGFIVKHGTDTSGVSNDFASGSANSFSLVNWPDTLKECVENGTCDIALIDRSARRVLKNKFDLGLFENPYRSWEDALEVFASDAYKAEQFELLTIADINAARGDYINELDKRVQYESAVLLKNDNAILPLSEGAKVFVTGSSSKISALDAAAISAYGTVVESAEEADVVFIRATAIDDNVELIIEDTVEIGKPIILALEGGNGSSEPDAFTVEHCDAILFQVYRVTADHGSSLGDFFSYTTPEVEAEMLFGKVEPSGSLVFEIGRSQDDTLFSFGDLQLDVGADTRTRLYMAAVVRANPNALLPANLGDVLYPYGFGMGYGQEADISLNTLIAPQVVATVEQESMWGGAQTVSKAVNKAQKSGAPFEISFIAENIGADGYTVVEALDGGAVVGSKFVSVEGGSFMVVTLEVTLDGVGEHVVTVGGLSAAITVE
ncbi:MAG: hypothetical protein LBS11_01495 [Oscillospiraceae bacterium]|jgi:beta-glucosidase|nr:hypothetical protein [Oscillospiraceae bacterium]